MNKISQRLLFFVFGLLFVTTAFAQIIIPPSLRQGISVDEVTVKIALEMQSQGWKYIMPQPKSPQAQWGHTDGRTTWYVGYWVNKNSNETSLKMPKKIGKRYVGDKKGGPSWRRGGSPLPPSRIEWLLSVSGGIEPRD